MMAPNTQIIELFIDDEYYDAGIDAISLVSRPAHDEQWMAFNSQIVESVSPYKIVEDDFCNHNSKLDTLGEPYSLLIDEGWDIIKMEKITPQMVHKMNQERFSSPNDESGLDEKDYRVRFKYIGPKDSKNRQFCADMLSKNRVYRFEDIENLSDTSANEAFGFYDIFMWRGSFNCRHVWVKLIYAKTGSIRNSGNSSKGLEKEEGLGPNEQPDTRTEATINSPTPKNQWKPGIPRAGTSFAEIKQSGAIEGYVKCDECGWEWEIEDGGKDPFICHKCGCDNSPSEATEFADSITDYPEGVKNAAAKAVAYAEKNGWGSCGTAVGKTRASQLAKGDAISVDTLKRMYSYLSRHKTDLTSSKSYDDGCGKLMYDSWGGEAGLTYAERKLKSLEKEKMVFAFNDDKQILIGAAMVPNKMISRYDDLGNLYYVFFSKASIKRLADKFLKEKRTDETSIEHDGVKLGSDKVFITESWVSENPIYDKSYEYGFELPAGTWFVAMKVNDPKVWKMIKQKALTGFSVEGSFAEKSVFSKEDQKINKIRKILKSIKDDE